MGKNHRKGRGRGRGNVMDFYEAAFDNSYNYRNYNYMPQTSTYTNVPIPQPRTSLSKQTDVRDVTEPISQVKITEVNEIVTQPGKKDSYNDNIPKSNYWTDQTQHNFEGVGTQNKTTHSINISESNYRTDQTQQNSEGVGTRKKTTHSINISESNYWTDQTQQNSEGVGTRKKTTHNGNIPESNYWTDQTQQNSERGGTQKKTIHNSSNSADTDTLAYLCINCEKCIHKRGISAHVQNSGHEILPVQQGIAKVENKELTKLQVIEQNVKGALETEQHINEALSFGLNLMMDPLLDTFGTLRESTSKDTHDLLTVADDVQKVKSLKRSMNFVDFLTFQSFAKEVGTRGEDILLESQQKPFWLVSTWFKVSLGLMLQNGKKCCSTLKNSSAFAPLAIQGDRILVSCFRRNEGTPPDKETLLLPYDFLTCICDKGDSSAFMRISYAGKDEGFVFVRIEKETFWGSQFIALCQGIHGYSYRNTRFFRAGMKGKPGHHIWGGDYSMNDGSGGRQVVGEKNDSLNANPKPIVKGLMAARFGVQDRSTIFRIFISGKEALPPKNSTDNEAIEDGAFGYIEDGFHILNHVANMADISKTVISDVGTILKVA